MMNHITPFDLIFNNLYWIFAVAQIFIIGILLITILHGTKHRHPVTLSFLLTSWLASWVALWPYLAGVWDNVHSLQPYLANVKPSPTIPFKICQANAIVLKYLWAVIPALVSVFSGEVLRILLASRVRYQGSTKLPIGFEVTRCDKGIGHLEDPKNSTTLTFFQRIRNRSIRTFGHLNRLTSKIITGFVTRNTLWETILVFIPITTSLPVPILTVKRFSSTGWREVYVDQFTCHALGQDIEKEVTLLIIWRFVPSSILSLISFVAYIHFCRTSKCKSAPAFELGLPVRLGALSTLSLLGAITGLVSVLKNQSENHPAKPIFSLYMIAFPLLSSLFFIDQSIIKIWCSWFQWTTSTIATRRRRRTSSSSDSSSESMLSHRFSRSSMLHFFQTNTAHTHRRSLESWHFHLDSEPTKIEAPRLSPLDPFDSLFSEYQSFDPSILPQIPITIYHPSPSKSSSESRSSSLEPEHLKSACF